MKPWEVGTLATAIVYVPGFIVVNVDLGFYGVNLLDLARGQYLLAGSMWLAFSILFPVSSVILWAKDQRSERGSLSGLKSCGCFVIGLVPALLLHLVAAVTTRDMYDPPAVTLLLWTIAVISASCHVAAAWWVSWEWMIRRESSAATRAPG